MNNRNIAKCVKCATIIESVYTHDLVYCNCGAIAIDGGTDYQRGIGEPADFINLSDAEVKAWDEKPTGRMEHWHLCTEGWASGCLYGDLYEDKRHRWREGQGIRTSPVQDLTVDLREGVVVATKNSTYLLGKPAARTTEKEQA